MSEERSNLDETIVVAAADETVAVPAVTTDDSTAVVSDETIVVNLVEASDETVVVNVAGLGDETVVVPGVVFAEDGTPDDATVVVVGLSGSADANAGPASAAEQHSAGSVNSVWGGLRGRRAAQSKSMGFFTGPAC